jgi:hypothetical protein
MHLSILIKKYERTGKAGMVVTNVTSDFFNVKPNNRMKII